MKTGKALLFASVLTAFFAATIIADPLPGESLLFTQRPMVETNIFGQTFFGHDEASNAVYVPGTFYPIYVGSFMADDFALKSNQAITHVKFWGGYLSNSSSQNVREFLISFESNVPASGSEPFSHPGVPLFSQSVEPGLPPQLASFTERLIRPKGGPPTQTPLYEYDAELWAPFHAVANTVYWLKIVALTGGAENFQWGWHNRDYLIEDLLAPTPPAVTPGENGFFSPIPEIPPIWHFEDDAVGGDVSITNFLAPGCACDFEVRQSSMSPRNYLADVDGPSYISQFSNDLAFELYGVPEPSAGFMLLAVVVARLKRRRPIIL